MADYYPLLANTIEGLEDRGPNARKDVYDRARAALTGQLRQLDPPLSDSEIEREGVALENAIVRAEAHFGSGPEPAVVGRNETGLEDREPVAAPLVAIRRGGRPLRSYALPIAVVACAVPIALVAWLWRDRPTGSPAEPSGSAPENVASPSAPPASGDAKYGERVGGGRPDAPATAATPPPGPSQAPSRPSAPAVPAASQAPAPVLPATSPAPAPAAPSSPSDLAVSVSQRALLYEENTGNPQEPRITPGRAIWQTDMVNGGQGQPLETVIRGRVDIPSLGISLGLTIRRNTDAALPASHTIELAFTTPPGDPGRVVRDVGLPQMRAEETVRGVALAGLPVPVKANVFLIGLSDLKSDVDRNTELLTKRSWMEIPVRLASGQKAALLFEKGVSGDRIFTAAFRQWSGTP